MRGAARGLRALGAAALVVSLGGCLSAVVEERQIGARADALEYERLVRSGDRLLLFYCFRRSPDRCDPKWSAVDLAKIDWNVLGTDEHVLTKHFVRLSIEDDPRPSLDQAGIEIPLVDLGARHNSIGYPGGPSPADMLERSAGRPLTAYRAGSYSILLVSREHRAEGAGFIQAINPTRGYLTWWAVPVRASLYAVTVPIDVVASPAEVLALWLFLRGMRE